jgi:hypothetical protein
MHKRRLCFQWLRQTNVNAPDGANKAAARPNPALEDEVVIPGRAPSREPGISINDLWIPGLRASARIPE